MFTLKFQEEAEKEWFGLDKGVRDRFLKVLERRLVEPRVPSALLKANLKACIRSNCKNQDTV